MLKYLFKTVMLIVLVGLFCSACVAGTHKKVSRTRKQYNPFARYQKNIKGIDARIKAEKSSRNPREKWIEKLEARKQKQQDTIKKKLKVELGILQKKLDTYNKRLETKTASGYNSKLYDSRIKHIEQKIASLKEVAGKDIAQQVERELNLEKENSGEVVPDKDKND